MRISPDEWRSRSETFEYEGMRIAYWMQEEGRPLLLLHGLPSGSWDWAKLWKMPGKKHRLIAIDLIGCGLSDKPNSTLSFDQQANMVLAFLDHIGVTEFDIIAHAYGASLAQELLARQQENAGAEGLDRVIFLNGGLFPEETRPAMLERINASKFGILTSKLLTRERFDKSIRALYGPSTKPSTAEMDAVWIFFNEHNGIRRFHRTLHYLKERSIHAQRWIKALEHAENRIGLICGARDPVAGEQIYNRWVRTVPNAEEHYLHDIGHYPHVEATSEVATAALDWLKRD